MAMTGKRDTARNTLRKRLLLVTAATVTILVAYLALWPVPVRPLAWSAPEAPGYVGVHAVNARLAGLSTIDLGGEEGPEHVALGPDGKLYVAVASGRILRMAPDGSDRQVLADTGGRVLGFAFDAAGNLIAADAWRGLTEIAPGGQVRLLSAAIDGDPIRYANSVVVAASGLVYFTDSSRRFSPVELGGTFEASIPDILEQSATGRVLVYDPTRGTTRLVAHGLSFANGIALSADEQRLLVAETGRYRVWTIAANAASLDLAQAPPGEASILLDNLPGYPDNLMRGLDGRIWLGFAKPRSRLIDALAAWPRLRAVTLRLPRALWPVPKPYGHVIAFTEDGRVVADLQDPSGTYPETTGLTETKERLYVQSLHARELGWMGR